MSERYGDLVVVWGNEVEIPRDYRPGDKAPPLLPVYNGGSKPTKILARFGQWVVTDLGIETAGDGDRYWTDKKGLAAETTRNGYGPMYDWPVHLTEKNWTKHEEIISAFCAALALHAGAYRPALNPAMLKRTVNFVRRRADYIAHRDKKTAEAA